MTRKIYLFAFLTFVTAIALFIAAIVGISRIELDNDINHFLPAHSKTSIADDKIASIYGDRNNFLVGIQSRSNDVFTLQNLDTIQQLTYLFQNIELEQKPSTSSDVLESDLLSLIDDTSKSSELTSKLRPPIRRVRSITNITIIEPLIEGINVITLQAPQTEKELTQFKYNVLTRSLYKDILFRQNKKNSSAITSIIITPRADLSGKEKTSVYKSIVQIVNSTQNNDLTFYLAGQETINILITSYILKDLRFLIPLVLITIIGILYFFFRKTTHILVALFPVLFSIVYTMGIIGFTHTPLSVISATIPIILVTIGGADAIHLLIHYLRDTHDIPRSQKVVNTVKSLLLPITMTTVTTSLGFMSLAFTNIIPIRTFGIFAAIGVLISWLMSVFFVPSLFVLLRIRPRPAKKTPTLHFQKKLTQSSIRWLHFLSRKQLFVWIAFLAGILLLALGIMNIKVDNDTLRYFKKQSPIVKSTTFYNTYLSGIYNIHLHFEGNQLTDPRVLAAMDRVEKHLLEKYPKIKKILGFHSFVKNMNYNLNYDRTLQEKQDFNEIPLDAQKYRITNSEINSYLQKIYHTSLRKASLEQKENAKNALLQKLIIQYLTLYGRNLDEYASGNVLKPNGIRMTLFMQQVNKRLIQNLTTDIKTILDSSLPTHIKYTIAGSPLTITAVNKYVLRNQIITILIALTVVFIFVWICFRSALMSLIAILSPMITFLITFAMMGITGLRLDIGTSLVAAMTIGVGIDYSIHFIALFQTAQKTMTFFSAIEYCYEKVGLSIFFNSVSVGLGFFVLVFSRFNVLAFAGGLSTLAMIISAILTLFFIPFLFYIEENRKEYMRKKRV